MGAAVAPSAHGIRTRRLHGVRGGGAGSRGRGSAADCRPFRAAVTHPAQTIKFSPAFFKRLRGMKGGSAPFYSAFCAALCAMRSRKRPCQPKTAKRIFGGPGSQGPSGQAKERTRVLPARRGFSAPGAPRHVLGWPFLRGLPLLCGILRPVSRRFFRRCVAALFPACGCPLFFVWPALPPPGGCVQDFPLVGPRSVALFPARVPRLLPVLCGFLRPLPFCPPCAFLHTFLPCFGCLFACSVLCAPGFSLLFFRPFLTDFCLSNFFSFVAQAATGLYFLPKRK